MSPPGQLNFTTGLAMLSASMKSSAFACEEQGLLAIAENVRDVHIELFSDTQQELKCRRHVTVFHVPDSRPAEAGPAGQLRLGNPLLFAKSTELPDDPLDNLALVHLESIRS